MICSLLFLSACDTYAHVNMATGSTAGTYYPFGGAMATAINRHTDINVTPMSSGGSIDNIQQLARGDAQIAIAQNDVMSYAATGTGIWGQRPPVDNLATLMSLYPETVQLVVPADSNIFSIYDLVGQRVSIGDIGSGVEANSMQILNAYGITQDDFAVFNLGFGPSADAIRDNRLDAFFITAAAPNPSIMDLASSRSLRLVPISGDAVQALMDRYHFYTKVTLDSNDYSFLTETIETVAVQATLVATTELDEYVAYNIVKALIENQPDVEAGHARGAYINPQNAIASISVDFHPGARRFFEEIGVLN